jgi:hypothetical protein
MRKLGRGVTETRLKKCAPYNPSQPTCHSHCEVKKSVIDWLSFSRKLWISTVWGGLTSLLLQIKDLGVALETLGPGTNTMATKKITTPGITKPQTTKSGVEIFSLIT